MDITPSSALPVITKLKVLKGYVDLIQKAYEKSRDWRLSLLFKSIDKQLNEGHALSAEDLNSLITGSHEEHFRESIYNAATKAILAESNLAIRVMAVITAKHIHNRALATYDDRLLLRGLLTLTDEEVIFARKLWEEYRAGRLAHKGEGTTEPGAHKRRKIEPTKEVKEHMGTPHYADYVEALKKSYVVADEPHGFLDAAGGWGYAVMLDRTGTFAEYVRIAMGLPPS